MNILRRLPDPDEVKREIPVSEKVAKIKKSRDAVLRDIFMGKSDLFALIIGPCSADNEEAVIDYTLRLAKIQEKVADKIFIVPRVYTNKPRPEKDIKEWQASLIRKKKRTCSKVFILSVRRISLS